MSSGTAVMQTPEFMMSMMKSMMEGITGPLTAVLAHSQADKSSVDSSSAKRKRAEAELEEERGTPVLVHIENHTIHDDAHSEFYWVA